MIQSGCTIGNMLSPPHIGAERLIVALNPAAGRGQGGARQAAMEAILARESFAARASGRQVEWQIERTRAPGDAVRIAREAAQQGAALVAAAGGDGTCGEVANGIAGTNARLGVIPLGTGNDFARHLGIGADLAKSIRTVIHGRAIPVDCGVILGASPRGSPLPERRFINVAGCGLDAVVAARVNRGFRHVRGTWAYVAALIESLAAFQPARVQITLDGEALELDAMLCTVANSCSYGGGMKIAPDARIDDGLLDLCILRACGRIELLRAFPRVYRGSHVTHPKVILRTARRITVVSDPPMPLLVDGDVMGQTPVEFRIEPAAVLVMSP